MVDLGKRELRLGFRKVDGSSPDVMVPVIDKFPGMGDMHLEGRKVVECSAELFVELMAGSGYLVIDPRTGEIAKMEGVSNE